MTGQKSDAQICRELQIGESLLSRWKKQFLDGASSVFEKESNDLLWLPATIPEKICLIMSSRPGRPIHRISYYLVARDTSSLYVRIIQRYQQDYESAQAGLVKDTLTALWAARRGLSESELLQILGSPDNNVPNAVWSPFLLSLETNLSNKGGLYSFANEALRQAVETLILSETEQRKAAHSSLADLFEASASLTRKVDELAWQLSESKEYNRLAIVLSDLELLHWELGPAIKSSQRHHSKNTIESLAAQRQSFERLRRVLAVSRRA